MYVMREQQLAMSSNYQAMPLDVLLSMFAFITEWIILLCRTKIKTSPVSFKSLLENLEPVKCINILRYSIQKIYKISGI